MDFVKQAMDRIRRMWGNLSGSQRVLLAASLAGAFLAIVWAGGATTGETMTRVVGAEVSDADRGRVVARLQEQNQRYELRNREIYVPKDDADRVLLQLASEGVLTDDAIWSFLEKSDIFADRVQKEKRYQVALQKKLEFMIRRIDGIRSASVLLNFVPQGTTGLFQGNPRPGASVMVELAAQKKLTQANVEAITRTVAKVVPGLEPEEVILSDTKGIAYRAMKAKGSARDASDIRDHERRIEEDLEERLLNLFPGARVMVRVAVRRQSVKKEEQTPGRAVVREEESSRKTTGGSGSSGGIKGEDSLDPATRPGGRGEDERQDSTKYVVGITQTSTDDPAGAIEKITASMSLPFEVGPDGKMDEAAAARKVGELKPLVKAALGPQATDQDISILAMPVRRPEPVVAEPLAERAWDFVGAEWGKIAMAVLALLALFVLVRLVARSMPAGGVEEIADLRARIEAEESPAEQMAVAGETADVAQLKSGIRDLVARNPAPGALVLNRWMTGK